MKMSPRTRKLLNLASGFLQASLDVIVHQLIISFLAGSLTFEVRVFLSGVIVVCFAFSSLYGFEALRRSFNAEKVLFVRSGILAAFLSVLFCLTSENPVSISQVLLCLVSFLCVSLLMRYSLRHVLASKSDKFFRPMMLKPEANSSSFANTEATADLQVSDFPSDMSLFAQKSLHTEENISSTSEVPPQSLKQKSHVPSIPLSLAKLAGFFTASPAHADTEGPTGEIDTSLRKDYRYNMKAILARKSKVYRFIKRLFDIISSGAALLILSPVFLVTAIAIKLEDGGPILYSANRWGKDMKNFRMHKFRSMRVNAEAMLKDLLKDSEMTGHAFKIKDDPRITKVGHFIRKYSIDELPQLWNIFTGDMSVVGPRAIMTVGTDTIDDYEKQRWLIQPGLTCYWQVSGRANIKWAQWVEMDLDYIEKMSLTEDIKLILKTFPVVFKADGAY
ncbi:MAG: sugar transferase [Synergistaceae bacterium]|nr:sugar transferase [Synergistaceae bacterium]